MSDAPEPSSGEKTKKFEGPVSVERVFKVDGKRLAVLVTFPGPVVAEYGMETIMAAAQRAIVTLDSKQHRIERHERGK